LALCHGDRIPEIAYKQGKWVFLFVFSKVSVYGHLALLVIWEIMQQYILAGVCGRGLFTSWLPRSKDERKG
jgi:hypothetical protein